jgi:hypothetical protein
MSRVIQLVSGTANSSAKLCLFQKSYPSIQELTAEYDIQD